MFTPSPSVDALGLSPFTFPGNNTRIVAGILGSYLACRYHAQLTCRGRTAFRYWILSTGLGFGKKQQNYNKKKLVEKKYYSKGEASYDAISWPQRLQKSLTTLQTIGEGSVVIVRVWVECYIDGRTRSCRISGYLEVAVRASQPGNLKYHTPCQRKHVEVRVKSVRQRV